MKNTENSRSLLATLWSGFLIFLCGFLANTVIGFVYGTMIGLQTRGDVAVISAKMQMFTSSPMFYGLLLLVVCVVAFWRGRVMGRRFDRRTAAKNIVLAVVLGMLLRTIVLAALARARMSALAPWLVGELLLALLIGILATRSVRRSDVH